MLKSISYLMLCTIIAYTQSVGITSTQMEANQTANIISFVGDAKVKQGDSWIFADKIVVHFDENNQTKSYNAIGNVRFEFIKEKSHYKGKAKELVYKPLKEQYVLIGNAYIDDLLNKRTIKGDEITLDMTTGNANVKGSRKKPVKFIFETENKK